jgi:hypothetical protein
MKEVVVMEVRDEDWRLLGRKKVVEKVVVVEKVS